MVRYCVNPARTTEHRRLRIEDLRGVVVVRREADKQLHSPSSGSNLDLAGHGSRGISLQRTVSSSAHLAIEHFGDWGKNAYVSHV
jgi:hypothetical protein